MKKQAEECRSTKDEDFSNISFSKSTTDIRKKYNVETTGKEKLQQRCSIVFIVAFEKVFIYRVGQVPPLSLIDLLTSNQSNAVQDQKDPSSSFT